MIAKIGIGVVALIHLAFAYLEIFRAEKVPKLLYPDVTDSMPYHVYRRSTRPAGPSTAVTRRTV